jgi:hypothetical protein
VANAVDLATTSKPAEPPQVVAPSGDTAFKVIE